MSEFGLDPRLKADTFEIKDLNLCRILRMNDRNFPWLVLVPMRQGARDVIDLAISDRAAMWVEVALAARATSRNRCP
jgi:diadenosine tetraphosphate (Ap4A) HIT family hydrolase